MNIIDKKFVSFIHEIENLSEEMIFSNIKENYNNLSQELQKVFEDYFEKYPYWGSLSASKNDFTHLELISKTLKQNLQDYILLYQNLKDYRSKQVLYAILNNYYKYDFTTLNKAVENNFPHYFDFDLIEPTNNEVFVDLGSYTGDTILEYIHSFGSTSYKKIYAYEITPTIFDVLKKNLENYRNIEFKNYAVLEQKKSVFIKENKESISANCIGDGTQKVKAVRLDDDIKEKITLLKMDIEGSEQQALLGAEKHIREDHPTLFISVYHNLEDLFKIPKIINNITDGYQFYLRYYGGNIYPTEVVLIAKYKNANK